MPTKLSPNVPVEFSRAKGLAFPTTARVGRGIAPTYAVQGSLGIYATEQATVTLAGSVDAGAVATLTGNIFLQTLTSLALTKTDQAQLLAIPVAITNSQAGMVMVSSVVPTIAAVGQPTVPTTQTLTPGLTYTGLQVNLAVDAYNPSGGSLDVALEVIVQVIVLGNVSQ